MQSVRRSRSVLVELMIAVLFLAVASCVLAQLFASAWETSGDSRRTQTAVLLRGTPLSASAQGKNCRKHGCRRWTGRNMRFPPG